eukprot:4919405-Amphidinium_carterae.1
MWPTCFEDCAYVSRHSKQFKSHVLGERIQGPWCCWSNSSKSLQEPQPPPVVAQHTSEEVEIDSPRHLHNMATANPPQHI